MNNAHVCVMQIYKSENYYNEREREISILAFQQTFICNYQYTSKLTFRQKENTLTYKNRMMKHCFL